jgi:hypothetical protein
MPTTANQVETCFTAGLLPPKFRRTLTSRLSPVSDDFATIVFAETRHRDIAPFFRMLSMQQRVMLMEQELKQLKEEAAEQ